MALLALTLPWLTPFSPGPAAGAVPWMVSAACFLLLVALGGLHALEVRVVAASWLLAGMISAGIGLLQYFGGTEPFGLWINGANVGEAYGNLRQRNQFATLTSLALLSLLWMQASPLGADKPAGWHATAGKLGTVLAAMILAAAAAASASRTGLLQWALILLLAGIWWRRGTTRAWLGAVWAFGCYVVAALALPWMLEHWTGVAAPHLVDRLADDTGCSSRRVLWTNVLHLIAQRPWIGWGWGELDYAHFITLYPGARFCDILDNAHNLPLHLAVELGIPLAALLCVVTLWIVVRLRPWRETLAQRQLAWAALAVVLLHSMVEYPLWYGPFQIAVLLAIRLLVATPQVVSPFPRSLLTVSATLGVGLLAWAAWDYWRVAQLYLPLEERAALYRDDTTAKVQNARWFSQQVGFATLTTRAVTGSNAASTKTLALEMLHFSPEPRVIEKLLESLQLTHEEALFHFYAQRYQAAFPESFALWSQSATQRGLVVP